VADEQQPRSLDLGHSILDLQRAERTGAAEVVFGERKRPEEILDITIAMRDAGQDLLITRIDADKAAFIAQQFADVEYHPVARMLVCRAPGIGEQRELAQTRVAIVSAGTSDGAVAEEAAITCEFYANPVLRINDVGVAGLHRLLDRLEEIRSARVIVVVAGMEGALPSVIGGLVDKPIIAVPTSVGYGASFGGLSALLGMLNSCASGVSVVNIDNGFGAGYMASMINRL
jgi:NCAIR mutase (PurE)-related protein